MLKKVLITVKTYPTISDKYDELVCTAGIDEEGNWVRMYPIPFRKLDYEQQYIKYQWMEFPLVKNTADHRPESYSVNDWSKVSPVGEVIDTQQGWHRRKEIIFKKHQPATNLSSIIQQAHDNHLSLVTFKPSKIIDFLCEPCERTWKQEKLDLLKFKSQQMSLLQSEEEVRKEFLVVDKLPYKFSYVFEDDAGTRSTMMIEDWELGMLYWNCLKGCEGDEHKAIEKVKQKYWGKIAQTDIHLFLGTTKQYHGWAKNPFVIIGVFWPPIEPQQALF